MDRAIRFILFALGISVGALFMIFADQSTDNALLAEGSVPESSQNRRTSPKELDFAELDIREREQSEHRAKMIAAAADREAVDPEWAPTTQRQIAEGFATHGPSGSSLISSTCKTSLCVIEIETLSREESGGLQPWHRFFGLARGWALTREQDGGYRSVIFLARDGHSLPG